MVYIICVPVGKPRKKAKFNTPQQCDFLPVFITKFQISVSVCLAIKDKLPIYRIVLVHMLGKAHAVSRLAAPVTVRMKVALAAAQTDKPLYVVFRDETGALVAFEAHYDAATGELVFYTDMAGVFVIVDFDFDGDLFSEEFYAALAALDAVKSLSA